jgi:ATP-binding cassette subfamily C protein LapB
MSGGQKQLVALTRLLMTDSTIWLLDEPTASMDATTETRCLDSLKQKIKLEHTLVLVTHKIPLLNMIDRLICVVNHKVVLDGPRDEILKKLASSIK